jgi:hypothetical protein
VVVVVAGMVVVVVAGMVPGGKTKLNVVVVVAGMVVVVVTKLLVTVAEQVTALPPPVAEPLHWLMVTGVDTAAVAPVTVQFTAVVPT